uniref:DNA-directed DNA polymerase n=1 Tax=Megaviridae environmental sample TaxID=1737588 RepID=A0A5J6VIT9_9VIRU|nr:MAG: DNA polymerase beta palm [Megaviridae environmental sample]
MNSLLVDQFKALAQYYQDEMDNDPSKTNYRFKVSTFRRVAKTIQKYPSPINSADDLKGLSGIGKGSLERIHEIITTGGLRELDNKNNVTKANSIASLEKIVGIGSKKAKDYYMMGIESPEQLYKEFQENNITLTHAIQMGLKYELGNVRLEVGIPRKEMNIIRDKLLTYMEEFDSDLDMVLCGSYRRGATQSNDIDVLIFHPKVTTKRQLKKSPILGEFCEYLREKRFLVDDLTPNYDKLEVEYMGFCKSMKRNVVRRIDIIMVPMESRHAATLYFTGSYAHNIKMRKQAKNLNLKLNRYGVFQGKTMLEADSEQDIFNYLEMPYLSPEART